MFKHFVMALLAVAWLSGCASTHTTAVSAGEETLRPDDGKALIYFMRPSSFGGAVQSTVYNDLDYIGTISAKTRIAYQVEPGEYMFMVIGESADFMQAEVLANKTYYVNVSPRMGVWKARFSLKPLNGVESQERIDKWFDSTKEVTPNEQGLKWVEENKVQVTKLHDKYLPVWEQKAEIDKQTLAADSGI